MSAATGALPSLSNVKAWDTEHLESAAAHWVRSASSWESTFTEVYQQMPSPGGTLWSGAAAEAAHLRAHNDRAKVLTAVDDLHDAATAARNGAADLQAAKQRVLSAVNGTQAAGYIVGEDCSVSYPHRVSSPAEAAARQAQAQLMSTEIRTRAATLVALDTEVASRITAATSNIGMLDFKEGPPGADALGIHNAKDVHRIVDPLPPGKNEGVKVFPRDSMRGLYETLTGNGTQIASQDYPGVVRVLEDGTRIGYREGSKSGGPTIDINYPDGTLVKIHQEDLPRPPAPAPAPAPAPVPEPAPARNPVGVPDMPNFSLPDLGPPPTLSPEQSGPLAAAGGIGLAILVLGALVLI